MASLQIHLTGKDLIYHRTVAASGHFFFFVILHTIKDKVCTRSLCNIFNLISEFYDFSMRKHHKMTLSNAFLKNYCVNVTWIRQRDFAETIETLLVSIYLK